MTLYIRNLIIEDNNDAVLRIKDKPAMESLIKALKFVKNKEGHLSFKQKLEKVDKEFMDYFDL